MGMVHLLRHCTGTADESGRYSVDPYEGGWLRAPPLNWQTPLTAAQ